MHAPTRIGALALATTLGLGACDLPTELPRWDTRWDVVVVSDTVSTAELLPDAIRVSPEGFVLDGFDSEGQVRLGDVCELCTCFDGPIPALEIAPHDWPVELPPRVLSASLVRGRADVVIHNEVGFDVLDDGAGDGGFLQVELVDSWSDEVYSTLLVDESFPPGDSLVLSFDLPAVELSPRIVARVSGRTPGSGCESMSLGPESGFRTNVVLRDVVSDAVRVSLSDADLALPGRDWALPGWLVDRLRSGDAEVVLEVSVESSVATAVDLDLSAAATPEALFSEHAALFTPLLLPAATDDAAGSVRRQYLVDLDALRGADHLWVASRTTVRDRVVELDGDESVSYSVRLRARVPTR